MEESPTAHACLQAQIESTQIGEDAGCRCKLALPLWRAFGSICQNLNVHTL